MYLYNRQLSRSPHMHSPVLLYRRAAPFVPWRELGQPQPEAKQKTVSERRGWKTSEAMVSSSDFGDIEKILLEQRSPFYLYFQSLYRANTAARLSGAGQILTRQFFNTTYQNIYGRLPGSEVLGTTDKPNMTVYLLSLNVQLQAYLMNAVHEGVHFFSCPIQGPGTRFHANYGHNITEGFTQFMAEEILKSQNVKIVNPPYADERAVAVALIQVVGIQAMADDYFRCRGRVIEILNRRQVAGEFTRLRVNADQQSEGEAKTAALRRLREYLESIRRPRRQISLSQLKAASRARRK